MKELFKNYFSAAKRLHFNAARMFSANDSDCFELYSPEAAPILQRISSVCKLGAGSPIRMVNPGALRPLKEIWR
jgi:hypothetical protein